MSKDDYVDSIKFNKPLTVVFCLPGNSFSGKFLDRWTELVLHCLRRGIQFYVSRQESCIVYFVRNMCLGGDVTRGSDQKPFDGKINYDYIMWLDSDNIFTPEQFDKLLLHDKDIVSGVYLMADGKNFATVIDWDTSYFEKNGTFKFLTPDDIKDKKDLIDVAYTGMGFMMVKRGVFESLNYPWFKQNKITIGNMVDFTSEDVAFCLDIREKGYKIYIDPTIRVGHEKKVIL